MARIQAWRLGGKPQLYLVADARGARYRLHASVRQEWHRKLRLEDLRGRLHGGGDISVASHRRNAGLLQSPSQRSLHGCGRGFAVRMTGIGLPYLSHRLGALPILVSNNGDALWHRHDQSDSRHGFGLAVIDLRHRRSVGWTVSDGRVEHVRRFKVQSEASASIDLRGHVQPVQPPTDQMKLVSSAQLRFRRNLLFGGVGGELSESEMAGRWRMRDFGL